MQALTNQLLNNVHSCVSTCEYVLQYLLVKGATESHRKIIFVSATKVGRNMTNFLLNYYFSS